MFLLVFIRFFFFVEMLTFLYIFNIIKYHLILFLFPIALSVIALAFRCRDGHEVSSELKEHLLSNHKGTRVVSK